MKYSLHCFVRCFKHKSLNFHIDRPPCGDSGHRDSGGNAAARAELRPQPRQNHQLHISAETARRQLDRLFA